MGGTRPVGEDGSQRWQRPLTEPTTWILAALVLVAIASTWAQGRSFVGIDYYQFWVVGQAVAGGETQHVYSAAESRRIGAAYLARARRDGSSQRQLRAAEQRAQLDNYSSPFLYAFLHVFASGDYETDLARHRALSLAAMLVAVLALCRLLGWTGTASLAMVLASLVWFDPFSSEMRVSNVNALQLGWLALILWLLRVPRQRWLAGLLLGTCVMFKPNVAPAAMLLASTWAMRGQGSKLISVGLGFAGGALLAVVWASAFFGSLHVWLDWLGALREMPAGVIGVTEGNYAPVMLIPGWSGGGSSIVVLCLLAAILLGFTWASGRAGRELAHPDPDRESTLDTLFVGAGCLVYLLAAPLTWQHYFILTLPSLALAFRPITTLDAGGPAELLARRVLPVAALIALNAMPIWALLPISHERFFPIANGFAVLTLYIVALWQIHQLNTSRWGIGGPGRRSD